MEKLDFSSTLPPRAARPGPQPAPLYNPAVAMEFFRHGGKPETVEQGATIFAENEKANRLLLRRDKIYLLLEGGVNLVARGKVIGTVRVGEIFGEMAAISDSPRSATAVAKAPCRVLALDDKAFQGALRQKPEFALMLMSIMIARLRSMLGRADARALAGEASKESSLFDKALVEALRRGLGEQAALRFERGKAIFSEGQAGHFMYVVAQGRVAISLAGAVVERVGPGGAFGEMALVEQTTRMASASAQTDCTLLAINRNVFLNLVKADPGFASSLLGAVAERLRFMASRPK